MSPDQYCVLQPTVPQHSCLDHEAELSIRRVLAESTARPYNALALFHMTQLIFHVLNCVGTVLHRTRVHPCAKIHLHVECDHDLQAIHLSSVHHSGRQRTHPRNRSPRHPRTHELCSILHATRLQENTRGRDAIRTRCSCQAHFAHRMVSRGETDVFRAFVSCLSNEPLTDVKELASAPGRQEERLFVSVCWCSCYTATRAHHWEPMQSHRLHSDAAATNLHQATDNFSNMSPTPCVVCRSIHANHGAANQ